MRVPVRFLAAAALGVGGAATILAAVAVLRPAALPLDDPYPHSAVAVHVELSDAGRSRRTVLILGKDGSELGYLLRYKVEGVTVLTVGFDGGVTALSPAASSVAARDFWRAVAEAFPPTRDRRRRGDPGEPFERRAGR